MGRTGHSGRLFLMVGFAMNLSACSIVTRVNEILSSNPKESPDSVSSSPDELIVDVQNDNDSKPVEGAMVKVQLYREVSGREKVGSPISGITNALGRVEFSGIPTFKVTERHRYFFAIEISRKDYRNKGLSYWGANFFDKGNVVSVSLRAE